MGSSLLRRPASCYTIGFGLETQDSDRPPQREHGWQWTHHVDGPRVDQIAGKARYHRSHEAPNLGTDRPVEVSGGPG